MEFKLTELANDRTEMGSLTIEADSAQAAIRHYHHMCVMQGVRPAEVRIIAAITLNQRSAT